LVSSLCEQAPFVNTVEVNKGFEDKSEISITEPCTEIICGVNGNCKVEVIGAVIRTDDDPTQFEF
jgi:hypothetical protein